MSSTGRAWCRPAGVIWHVLHDETDYVELGPDWFEQRTDTEAHARCLVRQLEKLGHRVTLEPAA